MRRLVSVLATALAATSLLPAPAALAQPARSAESNAITRVDAATSVVKGKATFYELRPGGGNCSYPSAPAGSLYVALSPREYAGGTACGGYLSVTGPRGTVRVKVVDQCPKCPAGHIDLSRTAFARVADPGKGMAGVTYRPVRDPRIGRRLSFRVKEESSRWWLALLVIDHGNSLTSVEMRGGGGAWRELARTDYNYWIARSGMGPGPFTVRVTDRRGHQATVRRVRLAPAVIQRTTAKMY
ncbi:expansin EXLX1 family cellulose-binding protein [Sphaerisporangium perillae]|uniref:expansin EXLX1 family cellulose-binding protein n=1 Tax=Sphaerisporangium perillae TaxID=2935860 RepID=UPI002010A6E6|nr:expansin EXLX1 family cellulose-binding protein [Sphaerisporangium perillae]